jgi:hypothetical protein
MHSKNKVRLAACLSPFLIAIWWYPTLGAYRDYIELLNHAPVVQVSVLALWVPIGALGAVSIIPPSACVALFTGKSLRTVIGEKWTPLINKIALYFALAGVAFAGGWTYHSINLLEKYGYEYSYNLTKITPTGIHLIYVKP